MTMLEFILIFAVVSYLFIELRRLKVVRQEKNAILTRIESILRENIYEDQDRLKKLTHAYMDKCEKELKLFFEHLDEIVTVKTHIALQEMLGKKKTRRVRK